MDETRGGGGGGGVPQPTHQVVFESWAGRKKKVEGVRSSAGGVQAMRVKHTLESKLYPPPYGKMQKCCRSACVPMAREKGTRTIYKVYFCRLQG